MIKVVSNASPLIGLSLIDELHLLKELWIRIIEIKEKNSPKFLMSILDYGEAEAIVLAQEIKADLIILDNREPRLFAHQIGLKVIGTIGVLLKAYDKQIVKNPLEEVYRLRNYGFYISDNLLDRIMSFLEDKNGEDKI